MFTTVKEHVITEIIRKKSRFIANLYHVESKEEAEKIIKEIKKKYFDSRHNCSSYRIIEEENIIEKANDDGEPSGTAGAPMLNILQKNNMCNILVIVTRYFGGILLGTGGLIRAYSEACLDALEKADKVEYIQGKEYEVKLNYSNIENFKYYCRKNNINIIKIEYFDDIICNIEIKKEQIPDFLKDIEKRNPNILEYKEVCLKYISV